MVNDKTTGKRDSSAISTNQNDPNKRYLFEPINLLTSNKFYIPHSASNIIHQSSDVKQTQEAMNTEEQTAVQKPKIPPVYLHEAKNYQAVLKDIQQETTEEFTTAYKGNFLRINLTNIEDYRKLTKFYDTSNIKYHTFKNPDSQTLSVVIRSVPISLTEEEIKTQLTNLEFPVTKVARLYNKAKYPIPVCAIELTKNDQANKIFSLTKLNYSIISVEPRRKSPDIPQCSRCQLFGHTKNYCKLTPRCVKCKENHHYKDCTKTSEEKPQCVNCNGEHPANYRGCPYFQTISQKSNKNQPPFPRRNIPFDNNPANFPPLPNHTSQQSNANTYSRTATNTNRNPLANQNNQNQEPTDLVMVILKTLLELLTPHIEKIKTALITLLPTLFTNGR